MTAVAAMPVSSPRGGDRAPAERAISITAPNLQRREFPIIGTAPYVQVRFSEKARIQIEEKQKQGSTANSKRKRPPRDYEDDYRYVHHVSEDGWRGIPANAFRNAMISACRLVAFKMTLAKLAVFVEADGYDAIDGTPLIRIEGEPEMLKMPMRNDSGGADIRVRAMYRTWKANVRVEYDGDQFTETDVANLLHRVGKQVGIGEGRPDSRESAGVGWGTFALDVGGR